MASSPHRVIGSELESGMAGCSHQPRMVENKYKLEQPLAGHHYLGSLERYMTRGDIRRNPGAHNGQNLRANYAKGDENNNSTSNGSKEDARWWIGGWLDSFVETHGSEKVLTVLGKDYATL